ncbi:MAG: PKD domain-containing protein [Rubricoccaceae bacterium]|nr:PKD domain-containing protein [Rubricoccaceae bacterium]
MLRVPTASSFTAAGTSRHRVPSVVLLVAVLVAAAIPARAQSFSDQLNPTGDPIGGGPGYSSTVDPATADFVVSSRGTLLSALAQARAGDVVYVDDAAEIDLTGDHGVVIPGGVTLASGRGRQGSQGGLIFSDATYPELDLISVFVTGGPGVRVTGLRFRGPSAEIHDHDYDLTGVGNLLRVEEGHADVEVDNCEFWAWDKWAVWLKYSDGAHVHHNYFHHNQRSGYGYGVWCGGTGTEEGSEALIEANLFDYGRHFIASSGHPNSWEARYNILGPHNISHKLDRHGGGAGLDTHVHHNLFFGDSGSDFAVGSEPSGEVTYHSNWSSHPNLDEAVEFRAPGGLDNPRFSAWDNTFGGVPDTWLPRAVIAASASSGPAPLTVTFDGSASTSPSGGAVRQYHWAFGDGRDAIGATARGERVQYTFTTPGLYYVELMVLDRDGLIDTEYHPVLVEPSAPGYLLSAWILDSYVGPLQDYYKKQILIDDDVVWEDDVAGDEGWQHVVLDVADAVAGKDEVRLAFRLFVETSVTDPQSQIVEITMYIDDVYLFGGDVGDNGMETKGVWRTATGRVGGGTTSGWGHTYYAVGRSGYQSIETSRNLNVTSEAGTWSEWYQPGVDVAAFAAQAQTVSFAAGWNVASLSVRPLDADFEALFAGLESEIQFVEDAQGRRFVPGGENEIGSWDTKKAYYVYADAPASMTVQGVPVLPELTPLTLEPEWNLVPFYGEEPMPVAEALASLGGDLLVAKDHEGRSYVPAIGTDDLGILRPGEGYRVYMERGGTLLYPTDSP